MNKNRPFLMKSHLIFPFLITVFAVGCQLKDPKTDVQYNIPDEFSTDLIEVRDSATGAAQLALHFQSVALFDCKNTGIETDFRWENDYAFVFLKKIIEPTVCDAGQAAAETLVQIGQPKSGDYSLLINLGGVVSNQAKLLVTDQTASLELADRAGVVLNHPMLRRIPAGTIWGFVGYRNSDDAPAAQLFLSELNKISGQADFNPGFYSDFQLAGPNSFALLLKKPDSFSTLDFVRQSTASKTDLKTLVEAFRHDATHPLVLEFWTTEGKL